MSNIYKLTYGLDTKGNHSILWVGTINSEKPTYYEVKLGRNRRIKKDEIGKINNPAEFLYSVWLLDEIQAEHYLSVMQEMASNEIKKLLVKYNTMQNINSMIVPVIESKKVDD